MHVTPLKLRDRSFDNWENEVLDRWEYADMKADPGWRRDWISFDCALYEPSQDRVYCGVTSFDADIFHAYDRRERRFVDLGYERVADPFDAKFHRSLEQWDEDGCLYAAIALLHDVNDYWNAPGGAIVRYDPRTGALNKLCIPLPHVYIQSLVLDSTRGILYGMCFTPERLVRYDLMTGAVRDLGPIGSGLGMAQGENVVLDDDGCAWCGWGVTRAWQSDPGVDGCRLCTYDPETDEMTYFREGLPRPDGEYGTVRVEGLFNLGTGCLYASGASGSIYRVDTDTGEGTFLTQPISDRPSRLASLRLGPDGMAYGVVGREGDTHVLRFDPRTETADLLGPVRAEDGTTCHQCHDVAIASDGTIYACENDNPRRSGYLWEIRM